MPNQEAFLKLVKEIESQGVDESTAAHYAALVGDTPLMEADGTILVREGHRIIARLKPLKFFDRAND